MSAIDKQLIGSNFCDLDCIDNDKTIHPESCTDVIRVSHDSEVSLAEWLKNDAKGGFGDYTSMKKWLEDNYNISSDYSLPIASASTLGGIKLNTTYFDIDNTGVFSLKDVSMSFTPNADYTNYINIGSLSNVFSDNTINISIPPFVTELELNNSELSAKSYIDNVLYNTSKILIDDLASFIANNSNLKNSFNGRWQLSITNNIIKLTDTVAQTSSQATLPYTNYTAGENINIVNGAISATDTTYEAFTGTNAGLVPTSTAADTDKYLRSDGTWEVPTNTTYNVATNNTLGLIKIGYTKEENKKPVQLDENNQAFVDTEQRPIVGGMITSGLSAHFFRIGTGSSAGSFTADKWIPILMTYSSNIGKCSVSFEIYGREDGKTSYAKYYLNHMSDTTYKLLCLSFYTEDTAFFDYNDIKCAKVSINNTVYIVIYKRVPNINDTMFVVNVLAENNVIYSTQHYFYTGSTSISDNTAYRLTNTDLRIGTLTDNSITARLENDSEATEYTMTTESPINATYYNPNN